MKVIEVIEAHELWVKSNEAEGKQLDPSIAECRDWGRNLKIFSSKNLKKANFQGLKLNNYVFRNSCLQDADFRESQLESANFRGAYLVGAYLEYAYCKRANFMGSNLFATTMINTNFSCAYLQYANMQFASIEHSTFDKARMQDTDLGNSILLNVDFDSADLSWSSFVEAQCSYVYLYNTKLNGIRGIEFLQRTQASEDRWASWTMKLMNQ